MKMKNTSWLIDKFLIICDLDLSSRLYCFVVVVVAVVLNAELGFDLVNNGWY